MKIHGLPSLPSAYSSPGAKEADAVAASFLCVAERARRRRDREMLRVRTDSMWMSVLDWMTDFDSSGFLSSVCTLVGLCGGELVVERSTSGRVLPRTRRKWVRCVWLKCFEAQWASS